MLNQKHRIVQVRCCLYLVFSILRSPSHAALPTMSSPKPQVRLRKSTCFPSPETLVNVIQAELLKCLHKGGGSIVLLNRRARQAARHTSNFHKKTGWA
jgi:hypothetical protein